MLKRVKKYLLAPLVVLSIMAIYVSYLFYMKQGNTNKANKRDVLMKHDKTKNYLQNQDSPYLLQHQSNPIDWYPYVKEALQIAKERNKLLFISIGYSTCHWCHVMEEESYEDEEIAKILNDDYISIKIDREEMPHLDAYYMSVYRALNNGGGGWPLNIIATPDNKPFYGFTYLPKEDKAGYAGLKTVLSNIVHTFKTDKQKIEQIANNVGQAFSASAKISIKSAKSANDLFVKNSNEIDELKTKEIIKNFINAWGERMDKINGGFRGEPKFPQASSINTLLDIAMLMNDTKAQQMATFSLQQMAMGGIHDQIEGGFYRYSVDEKWMIPHFEKMLYTNAELLESYTKAYTISQNEYFKQVAMDIVSLCESRFKQDNGLYFSASDADSALSFDDNSHKEEGHYFVFDYHELEGVISDEVINYFNITPDGNFEFKNNLYISDESFKNKPSKEQLRVDILRMKQIRSIKPYPFVDYKILLSWNSLYLKSLIGAKVLDDDYLQDALKSLDVLIDELYIDGVLYHQKIQKQAPSQKALFEDYAFFISLLLVAYNESLDDKYLSISVTLAKEAIDKFYKDNSWYMNDVSSKDSLHKDVLSPFYASAYANANAVMVDNLLKLSTLGVENSLMFAQVAKESMASAYAHALKYPLGYEDMVDVYLKATKEYVSVKNTKDALQDAIKQGKFDEFDKYGILLKRAVDNTNGDFVLCVSDRCFGVDKSFDNLKDKILNH